MTPVFLCLLTALTCPSDPAAGSPSTSPEATVAPQDEEELVTEWLVLDPVDGRGRRPFRPDAVVARHLLDPAAPAPAEGQGVSGERGEASWRTAQADEGGTVRGRVGWGYAALESGTDRIVRARLRGAWTLYVNGEAFPGDAYGYGWGGVPVQLRAGVNHLYVTGVRGGFRLSFHDLETGYVHGEWNRVLPDVLSGGSSTVHMGLHVMNATLEHTEGVEVRTGGDGVVGGRALHFEGMAPLAVRNLSTSLTAYKPKGTELVVETTIGSPWGEETLTIPLAIKTPDARGKRTFLSGIDGSVQEYAVLPPSGAPLEEGATMGLVLSLHGAGVYAPRQVGSYHPKADFWVVAPTNRRNFGFDWQDWGRTDAYEVLDRALAESGVDRRHVYLSGHSMGGHGVWHLGANDPDGFAAIAPSAGWQSFDTYGGRPDGALRELWHAADRASLTKDLVSNLIQLPVSILHGGADNNVPAREAQDMYALLTEAGGKPSLHLEGGKGHWWGMGFGPGSDCLDWPPFFHLFRRTSIALDPPELDFTTVDPGVDSRHHWVSVLQNHVGGDASRVRATWDAEESRVELECTNVRRLDVHAPASAASRVVRASGAELEVPAGSVGEDGVLRLLLAEDGGLRLGSAVPAEEKHPDRTGPLKRAFDHRFLLVIPTGGTEEENAAALARARYDAGQWWYRANGDAPILQDTRYVEERSRWIGRNVVLYGNADTNAAWDLVVDEACPLRVSRGNVTLGPESWDGEALGALVVRPLRGEPDHLVAILASTGPRADRAASTLGLFISGVGFPDYVVYGEEVLELGDGGVRTAGFFDNGWALTE